MQSLQPHLKWNTILTPKQHLRATNLCTYDVPLKSSNRKKISLRAVDINKLQLNLKLLVPPEIGHNNIIALIGLITISSSLPMMP